MLNMQKEPRKTKKMMAEHEPTQLNRNMTNEISRKLNSDTRN
jgi:DNA-binding transcriptional regulator WhiA